MARQSDGCRRDVTGICDVTHWSLSTKKTIHADTTTQTTYALLMKIPREPRPCEALDAPKSGHPCSLYQLAYLLAFTSRFALCLNSRALALSLA
jgi:hypothetical protein